MSEIQNPKNGQILSGSALKLIAVITMIIDHIGAFILIENPAAAGALFSGAPKWLTLYNITRTIGRAAFPIYCFLVAEGARYTRSRKRYGINLFAFALISEPVWNLIHNDTLRYEKQNVFFTLFLGYICICLCDLFREKPAALAGCAAGMVVLAVLLNADYGCKGMAMIPVMYLLREKHFERTIIACGLTSTPLRELPGIMLLWLYNGERGFIKGKVSKYVFYAIYPVHILILWQIRKHIYG